MTRSREARAAERANGTELVQEQDADDGTSRDSVVYTIGGPPIRFSALHGLPTTSSAALDGSGLVIASVGHGEGGREFPYTSRWALAPDGRVLTVTRSGGGAEHPWTARLVFDRQPQ